MLDMEAPKKPPTLAELLTAVEELAEAYRECDRNLAIAQRERTEALNRLNAAQKAWDDASKKLRETAPIASDWNNS